MWLTASTGCAITLISHPAEVAALPEKQERLPAKAIFEPYDEQAADVTAMQLDSAAQQAAPPTPAAGPAAPPAAPSPGAETPHPAPASPSRGRGQRRSKGRVKFAEKDDFRHIGGQQGSQVGCCVRLHAVRV